MPRAAHRSAQGSGQRGARALLLALCAAGVLALSGCGSSPKRGGGFYQDDGPPRETPRDLERTPDAVPRVEPFHPFANRPYTALGRSYTPITDDRPFRQRGFASWYGRQFHGNKTASGERYDMLAMTAAHPTLPLPSYVRVTSMKSGASVVVRVNDRGPFKADRIIDLSYAAATRLGIAAAGTGEVEVVRLTHADIRGGRVGRSSASSGGDGGSSSAARENESRTAVSLRAPLPPTALPLAGATAATAAVPAVLPAPAVVVGSVVAPIVAPAVAPIASVGPTSASGVSPGSGSGNAVMPAGTWAVQVGSFEVAGNAEALRERITLLLAGADGLASEERAPRVQRDGAMHRVLIGQFVRRDDAQALATRIERALDRETSLYLAR